MGKRKRKEKDSELRRKIRRLEKRLRRHSSSSESDSRRGLSSTPEPEAEPEPEPDFFPLSNSDSEEDQAPNPGVRSVVAVATVHKDAELSNNNLDSDVAPVNKRDETNTQADPANASAEPSFESLPADILAAIGNPKRKEEIFGPKVPDEISKRWGGILVDGLTKEDKKEIHDKMHIPENFRMIKAPLLNPEISAVLSESVRNRDKLLEKSQNHLGIGIAGLTNLASTLAAGSMDRIEILKRISEINMVFLDLHHENTMSRRKLVMSSLDKKFNSTILDAKRDTFLFGANLGDKIKATKTAEKSGLQIKRSDGPSTSNNRRGPPYPQGNWKGPPRPSKQRPGGQRNRYQPATQARRLPQASDKFSAGTKTNAKPRKPL